MYRRAKLPGISSFTFDHFLEEARQAPPVTDDQPARNLVSIVEGLLEMKRDCLIFEVHAHEEKLAIEMNNAPGTKRSVTWNWAADVVREYRDRKQKSGVNHGDTQRAAAPVDPGADQHDQKPKGSAPPAPNRLPQRASTPGMARVGPADAPPAQRKPPESAHKVSTQRKVKR